MKQAAEFRLFGEVLKTFGAQGQLLIKLKDEVAEQTIKKEPVFIYIDGLQVPFYIQSFSYKGTNKALVVFEDMDTEELAKELIGKVVYVVSKKRNEVGEESGLTDLVGFTVFDSDRGEIGKIIEIMPIPGNPCLVVAYGENEVIIPIHEELIERIALKEKKVFLTLPEGLLELYD